MIIISDSSPLIYLAWINQLNLLHSLFQKVIIPQTVYDEVVTQGLGKPGSFEIVKIDWIEVRKGSNLPQIKKLQQLLDKGEAEAISLAIEMDADLLIIDELKGREIATELGIAITGLLGILLRAKEKGFIPNVKDQINLLLNDTSFKVSQGVVNTILKLANEHK